MAKSKKAIIQCTPRCECYTKNPNSAPAIYCLATNMPTRDTAPCDNGFMRELRPQNCQINVAPLYPSINTWINKHHMQQYRMKEEWWNGKKGHLGAGYIVTADINRKDYYPYEKDESFRVEMHCFFGFERDRDRHNYIPKWLLDKLQTIGFLYKDSASEISSENIIFHNHNDGPHHHGILKLIQIKEGLAYENSNG